MDTAITKRERIEEILANRMMTRLPQIFWGVNCDSVKEALTFPENWLIQDFPETAKKDVMEYLNNAENGFKITKWAIKSELEIKNWMPVNVTGMLREVVIQFQNSFYFATRDMEESAENALIRFLDYRQSLLIERTENVLYREILIKKIEECNRSYSLSSKRVKNILFLNPDRMKINYALTYSGGYLYASKGGDVSSYVYQQERFFNDAVSSFLGIFFSSCNRYFFNKFDTSKNTRYLKVYMPPRCFEVVKNLLAPCGFLMELMPQDADYKYKELGFKIEYNIPVYITLHKVQYVYRTELSEEFNWNLQKICGQIRALS